MRLGVLLKDIEASVSGASLDTPISGVSYDSRTVAPGELFVALKGEQADGRRFISQAANRGAGAVMCDSPPPEETGLPWVSVSDTRIALACVAANFYGRPSQKLSLTGITGTNGKTTTAYILKSIFKAAGHRAGLIGTINYIVGDEEIKAPLTTPEAPEFQGLLRRMLDSGCTHAVCEVSSHALAQNRTDCTSFDVAVFTNLTRDHLDYHTDIEDYFRAKSRLFANLLAASGTAVVNIDDPYGCRLAGGHGREVITYGINGDADLRAQNIKSNILGLIFTLAYQGKRHTIKTALIGMPNVYNTLAALGAALALDIQWEHIARGIEAIENIPGRFELLRMGQDFQVLLDFAHTDDALKRLIDTARQITQGRVLVVFGCGGDRDRGKRPAMGALATGLCDKVFITSDNPRSEDPLAIINEIVAGTTRDNYEVVPERAMAIETALMEAQSGDTVLIAGKGHEDYQIIGGVRYEFSDRQVAQEVLARRVKGGSNVDA